MIVVVLHEPQELVNIAHVVRAVKNFGFKDLRLVSPREYDAYRVAGIGTGFGDEWIKLGATSEHTCDGSFSERTMALSVPYPGVEPPYKGNLIYKQDRS